MTLRGGSQAWSLSECLKAGMEGSLCNSTEDHILIISGITDKVKGGSEVAGKC